MHKSIVFFMVLIGLTLGFVHLAQAKTETPGGVISVDYRFTDMKLNAGYEGDKVDFVDEVGLSPTQNIPALSFEGWWNERNGISLEYWSLAYKGSKKLKEEIEWGDKTYRIGAEIKSKFSTSSTELLYCRRLMNEEQYTFDLHVGINYLNLGASLEGEVVGGGTEKEETSVGAPIPVIGGKFCYDITDSFNLSLLGRGLYIGYSGYSFSALDAKIAVGYDFTQNFGAQLGYSHFSLGGKGDDIKVSYQVGGPFLQLNFKW